MASQGQSSTPQQQGFDQLRLRLRRPSGSNNGLVAERIEAQGRIAEVPCGRCYTRRILCLVGSNAKRCAACARMGIKVHACGVNRDNYREFPEDEEEGDEDFSSDQTSTGSKHEDDQTSTGSQREDTPMADLPDTVPNAYAPTARPESSTASAYQQQPSNLALNSKIDWVNKKSMDIMISMGDDMGAIEERISVLEETVDKMQDQIRALQATVAALTGTGPTSG